MSHSPAWRIAVVGAGPAGLALALHAARCLPRARLSLFDARPLDKDVSGDPRTLALALGSVHWLRQLGAWPADQAADILAVHVSQQPPSWGQAAVRLTAAEQGVDRLGAVLPYGRLLAPLQAAWLAAQAAEPARLGTRFGQAVQALKPLPGGGVEVDAGVAETFDLVVVAEGGVFGEQARKAIVRPYGQTAWVGTVEIEGAAAGTAFERFTRAGPLALLPLPGAGSAPGLARAALVWCVASDDDPVRTLDGAQRLALLNTLLPPEAGRLCRLSPLKDFPLGLNAERTLVDGRCVRIGNAAQTLHPVAGQGLNLGLRDAHALVAALRFETDLDRALRRVEWARAADRWSLIATTELLARGFTWQAPGLAALRGLALAGLARATPLKTALARRMMYGWR